MGVKTLSFISKFSVSMVIVRLAIVTLAISVLAIPVNANESTNSESAIPSILEEVFIVGGKENFRELAGSGTLIDTESISKFDATDINDLLIEVPGVYIRYEDGYGLRPNIGVRGVKSDRSQSITLMEDGILISPAPYTAPAAYYFPNVNRMSALELVKGPAAIQHGPHTMGGALNMVTSRIPNGEEGKLELTYGTDNYQKARVFYGNSGEQWGYWVDGLRYSADGFKQLENSNDTGFERNDFNAKIRWKSAADARFSQSVVLKLGYADEDSNETYLGLTDADFALDPTRRYAASQLDNFISEHQQIHILHTIEFDNGLKLFTRAYDQEFSRAWNKFDGFIRPQEDELAVISVFQYPDLFPEQLGILRGDVNSSDFNDPYLIDVTNNDREYGSHGIAIDSGYEWQSGSATHELGVGLRFHHDYVERYHKQRGYFMEEGVLVFDEIENREPKTLNEASTDALSLYIQDTITINKLKVNLGLRYESIEGESFDFKDNTESTRSQDVIAPGIGVHYQWSESLGLLAGVYEGYSPTSSSSADDVDPEQAYNFEYGLRYQTSALESSIIGFYSDYSNYLGRCRASDVDCNPGDEFNGGEVEVSGVELTANYRVALGGATELPLDFTYTYTDSAFQNSFDSSFSQWGRVNAGDSLPYIPQNQLRVGVGLELADFSVSFVAKYIDEMFDVPAQGEKQPDESVPAYTTFDISAAWIFSDNLNLKLIAENLSDKQVIVSRRPFGARPNQPRSVKAAVSYAF